MFLVPKKNISRWLADIKKPQGTSPNEGTLPDALKEENAGQRFRQSPVSLGKIFIVFLVAALVVGAGSFFLFGILRTHMMQSVITGSTELRGALDDLKQLEFGHAAEKLDAANQATAASPLETISAVRNILPFFQNMGNTFGAFRVLSENAANGAKELTTIEGVLPVFLLGKDSGVVLSSLERLRDDVGNLLGASKTFGNGGGVGPMGLFPISAESYLSLQTSLSRGNDFLNALVGWMREPQEHHVLILLMNPSELRPGGGFVGSYAEATISSGTISHVIFHDINDADQLNTSKIVPPKPLWALVTRWRAADANWFFDFPSSAAHTAHMMEASDLYAKDGVRFDMVIGLSPRVAEDILALTGSLTVPEAHLTVSSSTVLIKLQEEVQVAQANGARAPKAALAVILPRLMEKFAALPEGARAELVHLAGQWIAEKDIMLYSPVTEFQRFFEAYGAAGDVMALPENVNRDYLAVVNANTEGGKTDLYMRQDVRFETHIAADGAVNDRVVVTRMHHGDESNFWWYRMQNVDYLQVFTPLGTQFADVSGGTKRVVSPRVAYAKDGYAVDPALASIEGTIAPSANPAISTLKEFGKNVFATWLVTPLGGSRTLTLDYTNRLALPPQKGGGYEFIFEKQAGSTGSYHFIINAPVGFRWQETASPTYDYASDDPPGRLLIKLTLEPLETTP